MKQWEIIGAAYLIEISENPCWDLDLDSSSETLMISWNNVIITIWLAITVLYLFPFQTIVVGGFFLSVKSEPDFDPVVPPDLQIISTEECLVSSHVGSLLTNW